MYSPLAHSSCTLNSYCIILMHTLKHLFTTLCTLLIPCFFQHTAQETLLATGHQMPHSLQVRHIYPLLQRDRSGWYPGRWPHGEPWGVPPQPPTRLRNSDLVNDLLCGRGHDWSTASRPRAKARWYTNVHVCVWESYYTVHFCRDILLASYMIM